MKQIVVGLANYSQIRTDGFRIHRGKVFWSANNPPTSWSSSFGHKGGANSVTQLKNGCIYIYVLDCLPQGSLCNKTLQFRKYRIGTRNYGYFSSEVCGRTNERHPSIFPLCGVGFRICGSSVPPNKPKPRQAGNNWSVVLVCKQVATTYFFFKDVTKRASLLFITLDCGVLLRGPGIVAGWNENASFSMIKPP